jgi:hypothetical protein
MAHFLNPVSKTELVTRMAPPTEYLFGISLKKRTCQKNAKTISADLAIATGPACSICRASVNKICPPKLKRARATTNNLIIKEFQSVFKLKIL